MLTGDKQLSREKAVSMEVIEQGRVKKADALEAREGLKGRVMMSANEETREQMIAEIRKQQGVVGVSKQRVDVQQELERLEKKDKRRRREERQSEEDDVKLEPTARAIKRAERKRRTTRRFTTKYSRSRSNSSKSSSSGSSSDEFTRP